MISERQLAKGFLELWDEVVPLLTPHFVHVFNQAYRTELGDYTGQVVHSVPSRRDTDAAIVSEFAFHVARLAYQQSASLADVANNESVLADAEAAALMLVRQYESPKTGERGSLSENERSEGLQLVGNYELFLSAESDAEIEFAPRIPGCGFVDECLADLSIGGTLFEVKTVERNIAGKDIRQLLVYLALQAATGRRRWSHAGFFNPRRGLVYRFCLDKMIPLMSGGRLTSEVFQQMADFFGTRDIQLDLAF